MTPELRLYHEDRDAWIAMIAPRMGAVIDANTDDELRRGWILMGNDFKTATWRLLNHEQKTRVRRVCS